MCKEPGTLQMKQPGPMSPKTPKKMKEAKNKATKTRWSQSPCMVCSYISSQLRTAEVLPTEQAVRPRRTLQSRKAVLLAGIVSVLRPAGGKPHGCRCGQGVGEMLVPTCQLTGMFRPVTTVYVGSCAETKK